MRQSPKTEPKEHLPFKRALEVWNKNIENSCLPNSGYQKRFRWKRLPQKIQGICGLPVVRTVQCCIDSPKWLVDFGTIYTIFTPLPKKRFDYCKIYGYKK
jgi:hypothetical protein